MRKIFFKACLLMLTLNSLAQPVGYYNGIADKTGDELKAVLHEIINDHVDFGYSQARYLINYSDADPENENNVILFYTQRSQDADSYGVGGNNINREHVWAKSHGNFSGLRPMDSDAFNLRPADASVNMDRSNKDFGNVKPNGVQHDEATDCWYTSQKWEPGDATKGQVARIIFYMATRYEGGEGEIDLEAVDGFDTADKATHGDLTTLLEWNRQFPPTDFERQRNNRLYTIQQNRNPFIDHPELADRIWAEAPVPAIRFDQFRIDPEIPRAGESAELSFNLQADIDLSELKFFWGKSYDDEENEIELAIGTENHSVEIDLRNNEPGDLIHYKILAIVFGDTTTHRGYFELPREIAYENTDKIQNVQGINTSTSYLNQTVTVAGRVVGNYDNTVYIQSGKKEYAGLCVYGALETGYVGDSLLITGEVTEYNELTELTNVSYVYNFSDNKPYDPIVITTADIGEAYEGMLVTIKDASFEAVGEVIPDENTNYEFSDAHGSASVYSRYGSRLVGKTIPYGVTDITGVVSQYLDDYQILPRDMNDLAVGLDTIPPVVTAVTAIDPNWVTIDFSERVEKESSELVGNYVFNNNQTLSVFRYQEATTVIVNVDRLSNGTHEITVSGIQDLSGNQIIESTHEFVSTFSSVTENREETVRLYPNPVQNGILYFSSQLLIEKVQVMNSLGQLVIEQNINAKEGQLKIDHPGMYTLLLCDENEKLNRQKIIVR